MYVKVHKSKKETLNNLGSHKYSMDDWPSSHKPYTSNQGSSEIQNVFSGQHTWHTATHGRPTYCNVCREQLSGVTFHGLSCEICKYKVHKRCVGKTISNCKWTTLATVGKDIIEDRHGNILMPHQWMEGNLPVSSKCTVCDKTCGSVMRLQDWRCLWCRATVHTACRPKHSIRCQLGPNRVSVVPPTAIHSIGTDESWEAVRPQGCSPLLVFVNAKSGDNQGVKFLRRFRQVLNPAQVFDLMVSGSTLGLQLFRHFDPFRILICSGDGSVGWVLSEIDRLNMQLQCEVGVLPLGTGNDLARVLGWGASCDDDSQVSQLLERYERATPKILDRWSIMVYERSLKVCDGGKLTLNVSNLPQSDLLSTATSYEDSVLSHLSQILQSDQHSVVLSTAKVLCSTIKDFIKQLSDVSSIQGDGEFSDKCSSLNAKLEHLLQVLNEEYIQAEVLNSQIESEEHREEEAVEEIPSKPKMRREQLLLRADSLKKAVRRVVEHTEKAVDEQQLHNTLSLFPPSPGSRSASSKGTIVKEIPSPATTPSSMVLNVSSISPLPEIRRDSTYSADINLDSLPVPKEFADSRHGSFAEPSELLPLQTIMEVETIERQRQRLRSVEEDSAFVMSEEALASIGHIDSSETSDESPEESKKAEESSPKVNLKCKPRESLKDSEYSCPTSIEVTCNLGSDLDVTNLFSTSPEDDECSEDYRKEMGLIDSAVKRCSIAHFVEGSDIARKSLKCRHTKKSLEDLDLECVAVEKKLLQQSLEKLPPDNLNIPRIHVSPDRTSVLSNNLVNLRIHSSQHNLTVSTDGLPQLETDINRRSYTVSETDDEDYVKFKSLTGSGTIANSSSTGPTVIIDPPSPPDEPEEDVIEVEEKSFQDHPRRLSSTIRRLSVASPLLFCSPSPSRRISYTSTHRESHRESSCSSSKAAQKELPIINPFVRLPQWPNVSDTGLIGKVLLANADALCAAAVPLMDPDDVLMEGFFERCVMNNYFGIGIDAKISLDFHHKREEFPEKCKSRARNYMWYGVLGSKEWLQKTYKNLEQRVQLECDGHKIPLPSLQGIVVLNIPSFMGGINFWGGNKEDEIFLAPSMDDHILEVVAVFGTVQMAASRLINLQHHRIAQCSTIQIHILGDEGVPVQVDGEAWIQPPGIIRIIHKNRMKMLARNKSLECSLRTWEEKQRQLRHQNILKPISFADEELKLLFGFIEATTTLIKCVKLLIISHPSIQPSLYDLAANVGLNLERVHPSGKILEGSQLRPVVSNLVTSAQRLQEETCLLLKDKDLNITPDIESQLNSALVQMEIELKKCTFVEITPNNSLVYFQVVSPDEQERKIGHRKSSAFWQRFRRGSGISLPRYTKKEVSCWGTSEVGGWLESMQMSEYIEAFSSHDIRGRELLNLTRRDLKELGVTKVGHVKRILLSVKDLAS